MVLVRRDVHARWGGVTCEDEHLPRLLLAQVLREVPDDSPAWLPEGTSVRWSVVTPPGSDLDPEGTDPVVVGEVGVGGWGNRVYAHMVPALRSSEWGSAGQTQLVAQKRRGEWWVRTLLQEEARDIFSHPKVNGALEVDGDETSEAHAWGEPIRAARPWALGVVRFLRPPLQWCPVHLQELISDEERAVCRGWMVQAGQDFKHMKHLH